MGGQLGGQSDAGANDSHNKRITLLNDLYAAAVADPHGHQSGNIARIPVNANDTTFPLAELREQRCLTGGMGGRPHRAMGRSAGVHHVLGIDPLLRFVLSWYVQLTRLAAD